MSDLLGLIEAGKEKLDQNLLSARLSDKTLSPQEKLQCVPYLSFFVLDAINDIATTVSSENTGETIRSVNQIESMPKASIFSM